MLCYAGWFKTMWLLTKTHLFVWTFFPEIHPIAFYSNKMIWNKGTSKWTTCKTERAIHTKRKLFGLTQKHLMTAVPLEKKTEYNFFMMLWFHCVFIWYCFYSCSIILESSRNCPSQKKKYITTCIVRARIVVNKCHSQFFKPTNNTIITFPSKRRFIY